MKWFFVLSLLIMPALYGNQTELVPAQEITVYQEIDDLMHHAKMDWAKFIYKLVRHKIDSLEAVDSSVSLYEQVMPLFVTPQMRRAIKMGTTYCSEIQLYEIASKIALEANDIDAMIVLSIASEQKRSASYHRPIYVVGVLTGIVLLYGAKVLYTMMNHKNAVLPVSV